jgi:hypothetical protein
MQAAQGVVADLPVETAQGNDGRSWIGKQWPDRIQLTVSLAQATQRFNAGNASRGGIDERLKAGERLPVDHGASLVVLVLVNPVDRIGARD